MITSLIAMTMLQSRDSVNLHDLANKANFLLGSCVAAGLLTSNADDGKYAATLAQAANLVEPENDLKPPALWQGPGKYTFENADVIIGAPGQEGWAQKNGMTVRGHVLVYAKDQGYTTPGWLVAQEKSLSADQARKLLRDYIHTVVGRYRGKIAMWDVVNEAIDDAPNDRPYHLRDSFWYRKLGPDFLALAFKYAHEADPKAKLYYNDYNVEFGGPKSDSMLALAQHLKDVGAPIDGLGLQYHIQLGNTVSPGDEHYQVLDRIKAMGLHFMVTELDIALKCTDLPRNDPNHGLIPLNPSEIADQAELYRHVLTMARSYDNCQGVQLWGFTDRHSWISGYEKGMGAALDFDASYAPKPAAFAIADVLKGG